MWNLQTLFFFFLTSKGDFGKNKYLASQLQKETSIITGSLHLFCGQQDVNLGVEDVDPALIFFHAYKINQKGF